VYIPPLVENFRLVTFVVGHRKEKNIFSRRRDVKGILAKVRKGAQEYGRGRGERQRADIISLIENSGHRLSGVRVKERQSGLWEKTWSQRGV